MPGTTYMATINLKAQELGGSTKAGQISAQG